MIGGLRKNKECEQGCRYGKKQHKKRLEKPAGFVCKECGTKVKKRDWVCKPVRL